METGTTDHENEGGGGSFLLSYPLPPPKSLSHLFFQLVSHKVASKDLLVGTEIPGSCGERELVPKSMLSPSE